MLAPLTLLAAFCLLLGIMLLFLRAFPLFLHLTSWLAGYSRGAAPTLALAQIARTPKQPIRIMLLLAFSTAFIMFSLIFNASQKQRLQDIATYQVGSDFSADVTLSYRLLPSSALSTLPGVAAASTGYVTTEQDSLTNASVTLLAVDTRTFAQATIWSAPDTSQRASTLLAQLTKASADAQAAMPAIVDAAAWQDLHLSIGRPFSLSNSNGTLNFVAMGEVQHLPTVIDTTAQNNTGEESLAGGVLVDFSTYNRLSGVNGVSYTTTTVWVKSQESAESVSLVRHELLKLEQPHSNTSIFISSFQDRRAIADGLQRDPLYLALLDILYTGAIASFLLALIGTLITSWQSAQSRMLNFSVLHALGGSRRQLTLTLLWEQGIVYLTGLLLGTLFGLILSFLTLPGLIFTNVGSGVEISTSAFYIIQSVPPIHMIIPWTLGAALTVFILLGMLTIAMMVGIVSRPTLGQTLRLNED